MTQIKHKSTQKQEAAQCLINNGFYAESIHCSYYSCLLYMKYILHHISTKKNAVSYEKQEIKGASTHMHILRLMKERINQPSKQKKVAKNFRYLKDMRNDADYSAELFSAKESYTVKKKAESLKKILTNTFGNL